MFETSQKFLNAIGTPHDKVWDERIWSYDVKIDGLMATAWTEYSFYLGDDFSHCGVNAFTLFKTVAGWKIVNVTDMTRMQKHFQTIRRKNIMVLLRRVVYRHTKENK